MQTSKRKDGLAGLNAHLATRWGPPLGEGKELVPPQAERSLTICNLEGFAADHFSLHHSFCASYFIHCTVD
jgi:hypothetical protein